MIKTTVYISPIALEKIRFWVKRAAAMEVSGFGTVMALPGGVAYVNDVILLKQTNGTAHTEIDADDLNRAQYELRASPGTFNFWWHSHGNGSVFFSGTDDATIHRLGSNGWLIASVFNTADECRTCIYSANPIAVYSSSESVELKAYYGATNEQQTQWENIYKEKVTEEKLSKKASRRLRRGLRTADTWGDSASDDFSALDDRDGAGIWRKLVRSEKEQRLSSERERSGVW